MKKDICYFETRRIRKEGKEYWQEERLHKQYNAKKEEGMYSFALQNTCQKCHAIRSALEIKNNACDNCD